MAVLEVLEVLAVQAVLAVLEVLAVQVVLAIFHFINYATEWLETYYFLQIM